DDHDLNRELCRRMLEQEGYQVLEARDGSEAVEVARAQLPGAILMDLAMPRMDGFQASQVLKGDEATRQIPVIALTARAMQSDEARAMREHFAAYVTKPVDGQVLARCVRSALERPGQGGEQRGPPH
ncbi:MAG TPA: response regulator, partial [Aggregicoccus sp.]|nr:response regulator [Aggregicoccus sp.]